MTFGRMQNNPQSEEVKELVDLLANLGLGGDASDPLQSNLDKEVWESDTQR